MQVLWGHLSPQLLQTVMAFALQDLENHKAGRLNLRAIEILASLGSHGVHKNNVWRDLKRRLPAIRLPKPHMFSLQMRHNVLGTTLYDTQAATHHIVGILPRSLNPHDGIWYMVYIYIYVQSLNRLGCVGCVVGAIESMCVCVYSRIT